MPDLKDRTTLDLDEDLPFQRREWRASRILLILLLLTMLAMGLGLFGDGPLSDVRIEAAGGALLVEYDRFGRFGASTRLTAHVRPDGDGATEIALSRPMVEGFVVTQVVPAPAETVLTQDAVTYRFNADPQSQTPIVFDLQPRQRWLVTGQVRSGRDAVSVTYFIYP